MQSKELLIKVEEGRIHSKYVKHGNIMFCKFSTEKNIWKTKPVSSCESPSWFEVKSFFFGFSKSIRVEVFQGMDLLSDSPIGVNILSISEIINSKKSWWGIYSGKNQIGSILLDISNKISPKGSPLSHSQEDFSFRILSEQGKSRKNSGEEVILSEDRLIVHEKKISLILEKMTFEFSKINKEKATLKEIKHNIIIKEANLVEERKEVERQKKEIADEMKSIQALRIKLSKDYADLKHEKFRHKTKKILLSSRQRKLLGISSQILRQRRLVNNKIPEFSTRPLIGHSLLGLSECVKPINADSDSPPDESPINTLESL